MLKFDELLYYKWSLSSMETFRDPAVSHYAHNPIKLLAKLKKTKFFLNVIISYDYWELTERFLHAYLENTPKEFWVVNYADLEPIERVVLRAFHNTLIVWLYLPIHLSDFFKYYSYNPIPINFDEIEFAYLDCWIQILPVFEDFLGHLLVNDIPLNKPVYYSNWVSAVFLKPPVEKDIDFSSHIREYFFGEGSIPEFKDVINLYLNNRLELKNRCIAALEADKQINNQIIDDLAVYFISHFLIKNVSKAALRFVVGNLDLSNKNPMKPYRDGLIAEWNSFSDKKKKKYWAWLKKQK